MKWRAWCAWAAVLLGSSRASAQPVLGVCANCDTDRVNCGMCIANGSACFDTLPSAERRAGVFQTPDGRDARSLRMARLIKGAPRSASDINRAVGRQYNDNRVWAFYGDGVTPGFCAPTGGPPRAFPDDASYRFGWDHRYEDALNGLDCYNAEVDRFYIGAPGHADGDRVCDGEQAMFLPEHGAIFDLGGEGNRVAVFPFTDHGPLPCESFEFTVWLSNNPDATLVAEPGSPDPDKWNPALLVRAFLQGWIPDVPTAGQTVGPALSPNLNNPTQRDGIVQVFALPCGLTFRYASVLAGNNGNPAPACQFWSFDAELDAVAGLNEDDTAICPDADGDGFRDMACGGNDCNDRDRTINPSAIETCATLRDMNCDGASPTCPSNTACINAVCAPRCVEDGCADGQTCIQNDAGLSYCLPSPCARVTCPDGQVCGPRGCQDPCEGAHCPPGQTCRGGACVDPCVGVLCAPRQHCEAGHCVANCPCVACRGGATCNASSGRCEAAGCASLMCPSGSLVNCLGATPQCVRPCEGVTCPLGSRCDTGTGRCQVDPCANITCPSGTRCTAGQCLRNAPDAGTLDGGVTTRDVPAATDLGARPDGAVYLDVVTRDDLTLLAPPSSGCACDVPARRTHTAVPWTLLAGLAALSRARRLTPRGSRAAPRRAPRRAAPRP